MKAAFRSDVIPRSFWLGGFRIEVRFDDTLLANGNGIGQASFLTQEIVLDSSAGSMQLVEQAFFYELVQWAFFMMAEHELRNNERVKDVFAQFLYQALKTAEPIADGSEDYKEDCPAIWDEDEEVDYDPGFNDDYDSCHEEMEMAQAEWEEEEESRREMEEEMACWADYAVSCARSDDEGWFYDDD